VQIFFGQGESGLRSSLDKDVLIFDTKILRTFSVCTNKGEGPCRHFADKRGGGSFSRFCADVFYGRPLTTFDSSVLLAYFSLHIATLQLLLVGAQNYPLLPAQIILARHCKKQQRIVYTSSILKCFAMILFYHHHL